MNGLVGFYDILGYQNIIDNNEINEISDLISSTLKVLPDDTKEAMLKMYSNEARPFVESFLKKIETKLISDSLFTHCEYDEGAPKADDKVWASWLFITYSKRLTKSMFLKGLPVRGALDYGEYYVDDQCIAGQPIIDSYRLAESLEFSGVVITEKALSALFTDQKFNYDMNDHGVISTIPTKNGDKKEFLLDWWTDPDGVPSPPDIRQLIFNAFRDHNKDIPSIVFKKLQNTELTIRALKHQRSLREKQEPLNQTTTS